MQDIVKCGKVSPMHNLDILGQYPEKLHDAIIDIPVEMR
jgi:hypothetical protein